MMVLHAVQNERFFVAVGGSNVMTAAVKPALILAALMMFVSLPTEPLVLEETRPWHAAANADLVADTTVTVGGGAEVVAITSLGASYAVVLSHAGSGSLGTWTWSGQTAGGAVAMLSSNGTVTQSVFTPHAPLQAVSTSNTLVLAADHAGVGVILQHYDCLLYTSDAADE